MLDDDKKPVLTWRDVLAGQKEQPYFKKIMQSLHERRKKGRVIYPPQKDIFNAFRKPEFSEIKVVILGQDPYHGLGQAHGLAFSVSPGVKIPPSLVNIYKELQSDIENFTIPDHGHLQNWAQQGVFLLNSALSVEAGQAHSHAELGWENFTNYVVSALSTYHRGLVFLLWGSHAQKRENLIDLERHFILKSVHPSPLSAHRGFFGCRHFSKTNQLLESQGLKPINWQI